MSNSTSQPPAAATVSVDEFLKTNFDYLILGGGTAGLVIAARLSEDANVVIGVIEAGSHKVNDPLVDTPTTFPQMFENPEYDWNMYTVPQV